MSYKKRLIAVATAAAAAAAADASASRGFKLDLKAKSRPPRLCHVLATHMITSDCTLGTPLKHCPTATSRRWRTKSLHLVSHWLVLDLSSTNSLTDHAIFRHQQCLVRLSFSLHQKDNQTSSSLNHNLFTRAQVKLSICFFR
jgi:hypothetical protein